MKLAEYKALLKTESKINKYKSRKCIIGGIKFDSEKEGRYYKKLLLAKKSGELLFFLRQVPFELTAGVKYRLDFLEFWKDGRVKFVDVKGVSTQVFKIKKKQVEALYPVKIEVI